jgi:hypothetical protein
MVVKMMVVRPADIDEGVLRRNGTGAITVRAHHVEDDDGRLTRAYAVSADFFLPGTDQRNFRTLEHAMGFVVGLVSAAEEATARLHLKQSTIEIQVEI